MLIQKPLPGTPLIPHHPHLDGLVAWWLFQEGMGDKIHDLSGNENTGTALGFAFPPTVASGWNPGRNGKVLIYDGADDNVFASGVVNVPQTRGAIVFWTKPTTVGSAVGAFVSISDGSSTNVVAVYLGSSGTRLYVFASGGGVGTNVWQHDTAVNILSNGVWQHVAVNYDTVADNYQVYIDGILITPDSSNVSNNPTGMDEVRIGSFPGGGTYLNGQMDDVRIYNRILLRGEIQEIKANQFAAFQLPGVILSMWVPLEAPPYEPDLYNFTQIEKSRFLELSRAKVRHPTFSVFVGGHGDITSDGLSSQYTRRAEDSLHEPNYGTGTLTISDDREAYIENGRSIFRHGDQVMLFGGFDDLNIPLFSGLVREIQVQASAKVQTLTIAEQGYRLRKSKTSGDFSSYETPKKLVDYLVDLARIGEVVYEDETGPPTTFEFGNTELSLRSFWAMVHGAALCIQYIQFFDEKGRLNLARRTTFEDTGYIFTDSDIYRLKHVQFAELINHKTIDFVKCITPEFTAGDGIHPGQHTRSRTESVSKHKYGEYEDQETDELIGNWTNAGKMIDQILDFYPFPRHIYQMDIPALPQLKIADRLFISSDETGVEGYFVIIGESEQINTAGYNGQYTLLSAGELF